MSGPFHRDDRNGLAASARQQDRTRCALRRTHGASVGPASRRSIESAREPAVNEAARWRIGLVVGLIALLEIATRLAWINPVSFIPPSRMAVSAWDILTSGQFTVDIVQTLGSALAAVALAVIVGFVGGVLLYRLPRLRRVLDPLLLSYYAVPVFVLYPILIVVFGLNRWPLVGIGFLFSVVAMAVNTLNGLERVP